MIRISLPLLALLVLVGCAPAQKTGVLDFDPYHYSSPKNTNTQKGAVVSGHPIASKVGLQILKKGGNAMDAAIATQLALAVVYPNAGNLGGGGFLVASMPGGKEVAIDYREKAPSHASRDMYLDKDGNALTDVSQAGHLSAGVPGTVAGLFASAKFGRLPFDQLIAPAIELARKGFAISDGEAASLNSLQSDLKKYNTRPSAFEKGTPWKGGDTLIQTDLANTLKRIRDNGVTGFYEGETARLVAEEMQRGHGIITVDDMKAYTAELREPHAFNYKGYRIIGMPMPSSGGTLLHQMMKMIEPRNIGTMGFESPASVQLMTETERRAFADRAKYMGDVDFYKVPVKEITDSMYLDARMKDYVAGVAGVSERVKPGDVPGYESKQTTHLSVLDSDGNAVSVTTTLNNSFGSHVVVGGAGFFMNDEMDDFSIKPGVPNMYGAVGGEANSIQPGKRMLSSMTPTVVLKDGKPFMVVGTPGGTTIPTSVFQTIVNVIEFDMSAADAVNKPKFHHQWLPDEIMIEKGFSDSVSQALQRMGYKLNPVSQIGRVELIHVLPDGTLEAVADHRGEDAAEGW